MTWTNITIPEKHDIRKKQAEEIQLLLFKLQQKDSLIDCLYKELENIFESIKENKEVTISYENETIQVRLVE